MKTRGFEIVTKYKDKGINLPRRQTIASAGYDIEAKKGYCDSKYLEIEFCEDFSLDS